MNYDQNKLQEDLETDVATQEIDIDNCMTSSIGGYSYTFDDLQVFATLTLNTRTEYSDKTILLSHFMTYLRKNRAQIPFYPAKWDPAFWVNAYEDVRAPEQICFIVGMQHGRRPLSHRFKPNENDEYIRVICAEMFGFPENPPFRTVKDPWYTACLPREWRELPEWYSTSEDSA